MAPNKKNSSINRKQMHKMSLKKKNQIDESPWGFLMQNSCNFENIKGYYYVSGTKATFSVQFQVLRLIPIAYGIMKNSR